MRARTALAAVVLILIISLAPMSEAAGTCTVTFQMPDGTVVGTVSVEPGSQMDLSLIPKPIVPAGATFMGWGDVTMTIVEDTTFTAILEYGSETFAVRYLSEPGGVCIHTEYVKAGEAATYDLIPEKASSGGYDYTFKGWSADLSHVTSDVSVYPMFEQSKKMVEVRFFNYDRTPICTMEVPYGESLKTLPEDPARPSTVAYDYEFSMWSITPNGGSPASFENVTDTRFAYAYFQPHLRSYTVSFILDGNVVSTENVLYNTRIGTNPALSLFEGEAMALMYRDPALTKPLSSSYTVIGDTNVHVEKVPGILSVEGDVVSVKQTESTLKSIAPKDGVFTVCDLSQFSNGTTASIDGESVKAIASILKDSDVRISVPRGSITMKAEILEAILGDSDSISLNVTNGPSGVKTAAALKSINHSGYYSMNLTSGDRKVSDLGTMATISFPLTLAEGLNPAAWEITSKGEAILVESTYDGKTISIATDSIKLFAVGTDTIGSGTLEEKIVMPYGKAEYSIEQASDYGGPPGMRVSILESIDGDFGGNVLFVPSSIGGELLVSISAGAFNSARGASAIVIPATVQSFDWDGWSSDAPAVYFLGSPEFIGEAPSFATVHGLWEQDDSFFERTYLGSYKKDPFSFTFVVIEGNAMINRYVSGTYIAIPDAISADGSDYPVRWIGDASFARTTDPWLREAYGLLYERYAVETVEIPSTVTEVMARAFMGSTVKTIYGADSVEHVWDEAFKGCGSLAMFRIPETVLYIGDGAFQACSSKSFSRLTMPDGVKVLGESAFYGCSELRSVKLSESLTSVPANCFSQCTSLMSIDIPASVRSIGDGAFYNCGGLLYIDLMNTETVGYGAFQSPSGKSKLECVVFGESLKTLGDSAFGNCVGIAEIEAYCPVPDNMEAAFKGTDLGSVTFYVSYDQKDDWSVFEDVVVLESTLKEEKDWTMAYVVIGLILLFVVLGALSLKLRLKVSRGMK